MTESPRAPLPAADPLLVLVGARLRALRLALGLSQDAFADLTGLHRSYVGQIEHGHKDLRLTTLHRLARTAGLEAHQLLDPEVSLEDVQLSVQVLER